MGNAPNMMIDPDGGLAGGGGPSFWTRLKAFVTGGTISNSGRFVFNTGQRVAGRALATQALKTAGTLAYANAGRLNNSLSSSSEVPLNTSNGINSQDERIDLSQPNSGQLLVDELGKYYKEKTNDSRIEPPFLEEIIDISTDFHEGSGYDPITSVASGKRRILNRTIEITIWKRTDLGGNFLQRYGDNQIGDIQVVRGKQSKPRGPISQYILITNQSAKGLIRFELPSVYNVSDAKSNLDYLNKLHNHIRGK